MNLFSFLGTVQTSADLAYMSDLMAKILSEMISDKIRTEFSGETVMFSDDLFEMNLHNDDDGHITIKGKSGIPFNELTAALKAISSLSFENDIIVYFEVYDINNKILEVI